MSQYFVIFSTSEADGNVAASPQVAELLAHQLSSTSVNINPPPPSPRDVTNIDRDKTDPQSKDRK